MEVIYVFFMSFLHFETHKFYMDILVYNFCTNYIEILWYWKFMP
jgi:hypothetical protein